jgi:hypothetical protein
MAYLLKGIVNLKKFIKGKQNLESIETEFRMKLMQRLTENLDLMRQIEPYNASKLLRYVLSYNQLLDDSSEKLYESIAYSLCERLDSRKAAL